MTDSNQIHPRWGRPLNQYVHSWGSDSFRKRAHWDARAESEIRNHARTAISMICDMGLPEDDEEGPPRITLSMLRSIADLALSPGTFSELGYPKLVDGCIRLMRMVSLSKVMLFKYEYGYICFRIMIIALDVCCLQRAKRFDRTIARMQAEPETEMLSILSEEVSYLALNLLSDKQGTRCDWLLGMNTYDPLYGSQQMAFTTDQGLMFLLTLLFLDQKGFLKALGSTYSPGLSMVLTALWRYVVPRAPRMEIALGKTLVSMFYLAYFRYTLVAPICEDAFLASIYYNVEWWAATKDRPADEEDEREKIMICTRRLSSAGTHWFCPPLVSRIPIMTQYLLSRLANGVEDLLPRLFGSTINRLWDARIRNESTGDQFLKTVKNTIGFLRSGLECLNERSYSDQLVLSELADELIRHDMLDLIAQIAFSLPVRPQGLSEQENENLQFMACSVAFFKSLSNLIPKDPLRIKFRVVLPDIWKYILHSLQMVSMHEPALSDHFSQMGDCMLRIGIVIGFKHELLAAQDEWAYCNHERCPSPQDKVRSLLACDRCGAAYCSKACQVSEWMNGSMRSWHKLTCGNILPRIDVPWHLAKQAAHEMTQGPNPLDMGDFMYWGHK
ncbi:unnamed protein product [Rhizoctonia solani]|uniref:MYND-type domain-containing protein n=1 Tax=Rhizoctonia solani TaxID=456999 RepID=A0A8H3BD52_9AGAM|nr:unnamed protein product [Rhizoctonia solani]